jgi:hypothetical protein
MSGALAVAATASAAFSFFLPSVLTGAQVGNGNLRGTALVVLLLGAPTLLTAMVRTRRGSTRWLVDECCCLAVSDRPGAAQSTRIPRR